MESREMMIAVYCGAAWGAGDTYKNAARALGTAMASRGIGLVYGGGRLGLMGEVADAMIAAGQGGRVIGVITHDLKHKELAHNGLSDLRVVDTMHARKKQMADLASAFIALPGGVGTMDELFEMLAWSQLGIHNHPVGLLNIDGFYDHIIAWMRHAARERFLRTEVDEILIVETDPVRLLDRLTAARPGVITRRAWDREPARSE